MGWLKKVVKKVGKKAVRAGAAYLTGGQSEVALAAMNTGGGGGGGGGGNDYLGLAGSLASGYLGSKASKKASKAQVDSANYAAQLQQQQLDKQIALNAPFRDAGIAAQNRLLQLYGLGENTSPDYGSAMRDFSAADFQADPGYEFRQQQGRQGIERSAAARGGLFSGSAVKDAMRFNQGLASDEYTNAYNRFQTNRSNKLNPLQSLMGSGQTATGQLTNASQMYATNAGNAAMASGNARASGYMGQANAISDALGQGINNYQQNQLLRRGFPTQTPPFNPSYGSFPSYDGSSVQG